MEYDNLLTDWHNLILSLKQDQVADEIGNHFLPYFLYKWLPKIEIQFDDSDPHNITEHFRAIFQEYAKGTFECEIDDGVESLTYSLTRIPKSRKFPSHCLLLAAADRIVGAPRDLTNKLGEQHFVDDKGERYIVIAVVRGEAFEARLNDARTSINLPAKAVEAIVGSVSDVIQTRESDQIKKIKDTQSTDLATALQENPILRLGLRGRTVAEYVAARPNNWKAEQFIQDLALERYRATNDLTKKIVAASNDLENYDQSIKEIVGKIDEGKKEALAEYVIHRRNIISLVEAAQRYNDKNERAPEDRIHDLIFKRFTDSTTTSYFEHNLWLIDDAMAFLPYITSDRSMHGKGRKKGDKVTDLFLFDDSMVLGDDEGTAISIVEFKRPGRDDYAFGNVKTDPVLQVIETMEKAISAGGVTKVDGTHLSFSAVSRRFAYIIADVTPTLIKVLGLHDFKNDWNKKVWVRYREKESIFIQAFGFQTLVEQAKKRNQAFFSVLLGE